MVGGGIRVTNGESIDVADNEVVNVRGGVSHPSCHNTMAREGFGIEATGTVRLVVLRNRVSRVFGGNGVTPERQCGGLYGADAHGIATDGVVEAQIRANEVAEVQGGAGSGHLGTGNGGAGGAAQGIRLRATRAFELVGNRVEDTRGGRGHTGWDESDDGARYFAGDPGDANGIALTETSEGRVDDNEVTLVRGAEGTNGGVGILRGTRGGQATALHVTETSDVVFSGNSVSDLAGGDGGGGAGRGPAWAMYLDAVSDGLEAGPTNRYGDTALAVYIGVERALVLADLEVSGATTTNWGQVVIRRAQGVRLERLRVSDHVGAEGRWGAAGSTRGVPDAGGHGTGIWIEASRDVVLDGVSVSGIRGGRGGQSSAVRISHAGAGSARAVMLLGCEAVQIAGLEVDDVLPGPVWPGAAAGMGVGIRLDDTTATLRNSIFEGLDVGVLYGPASRLGDVANITVYGGGVGIDVLSNDLQLLTVHDSIFAALEGPAVRNHADNAPFPVRYCAFDRVADPPAENVALEEETLVRANAAFTSEIFGDYALTPQSPCVDAGDPAAACDNEPEGDGACRLDMGHLGNTPAARAQ